MATEGNNKAEELITIADDEDDSDPDEYNVERIVARRKDPATGGYEYLIKWENYPDSQNTWEPSEHLKCPDLIAKFNEAEKAKRKKRSLPEKRSSQSKKTKGTDDEIDFLNGEPLLAEDGNYNASSSEQQAANTDQSDRGNAEKRPKGFERGLPIERIVGSCTDDSGAVWFFIKWRGHDELELVEIDEIEQNAAKELCVWYRERLYHSLKAYDTLPEAERHMSQAVT